MEKNKVIIISLLIVLTISSVLAFSNTQAIRECKRDALNERRAEQKECTDNNKECQISCNQEKKNCLQQATQEYRNCFQECNDRECKRTCSKNQVVEKKQCYSNQCSKECRDNFNTCNKGTKERYEEKRENCEISPFQIEREDCENAGGFYHEICNGPYFDIICSPQKFCICEGDSEYTCPENYTCNKNIKNFLPRARNTIQGYKDFLGNDLGKIGVCEKQEQKEL